MLTQSGVLKRLRLNDSHRAKHCGNISPMRLKLVLISTSFGAGLLLSGCGSGTQSTPPLQAPASSVGSAPAPAAMPAAAMPAHDQTLGASVPANSSLGSPVTVSAPAAPVATPVPPTPTPASASQDGSPLSSNLSPTDFISNASDQVRAAGSETQLDALDAQFRRDERQFHQVMRSSSDRSQLAVAMPMVEAMQWMQQAVAVRRVELSGQDPMRQPPYVTLKACFRSAQIGADIAQQSIEHANAERGNGSTSSQ